MFFLSNWTKAGRDEDTSVFPSAIIVSHRLLGSKHHKPKWHKGKEIQTPQNKKGEQCTPAEREQLWQSTGGNEVPAGGVLWVSPSTVSYPDGSAEHDMLRHSDMPFLLLLCPPVVLVWLVFLHVSISDHNYSNLFLFGMVEDQSANQTGAVSKTGPHTQCWVVPLYFYCWLCKYYHSSDGWNSGYLKKKNPKPERSFLPLTFSSALCMWFSLDGFSSLWVLGLQGMSFYNMLLSVIALYWTLSLKLALIRWKPVCHFSIRFMFIPHREEISGGFWVTNSVGRSGHLSLTESKSQKQKPKSIFLWCYSSQSSGTASFHTPQTRSSIS